MGSICSVNFSFKNSITFLLFYNLTYRVVYFVCLTKYGHEKKYGLTEFFGKNMTKSARKKYFYFSSTNFSYGGKINYLSKIYCTLDHLPLFPVGWAEVSGPMLI